MLRYCQGGGGGDITEERLYIHRNYCLQAINGKTGLEHLTSLEEIKARPNLDILTEYQKWVDEQSDLLDAIMGMYRLDTSSENADVEDEEKEERMSTWVNSLRGHVSAFSYMVRQTNNSGLVAILYMVRQAKSRKLPCLGTQDKQTVT